MYIRVSGSDCNLTLVSRVCFKTVICVGEAITTVTNQTNTNLTLPYRYIFSSVHLTLKSRSILLIADIFCWISALGGGVCWL